MITQNINMQRSRTGNIIVTVTNIDSWAGLTAKLYVGAGYKEPPIFELDGSIDTVANTIAFHYTIDDSELLIKSSYVYEVVLFNADLSFSQTTTQGVVTVTKIIKVAPTT